MFKLLNEKELNYKEIVDISKDLIKSQYMMFLFVWLVVYVPIELITFFFGLNEKNVSAPLSILSILFSFLSFIGVMSGSFITEYYVTKGKDDNVWKMSLSASLNRFLPSTWTNIVAGIVIIFMTLLLVVPGIIWGVYYSFIVQVSMLRDLSGQDALKYSKKLVEGKWGKTFGRLLGSGITIAFPFIIALIVVSLIGGVIDNLLLGLISDLISIFVAIPTTLVFLNYDYLSKKSSDSTTTNV
jgi:hypothetical protein